MQKGDFRPSVNQKLSPITEAQGERIIRLLERLVALSQDSLDQMLAEELKHHNAAYPSGH